MSMLKYIMSVVRMDMIFFFKQKTAYEMRISDWSSDVCSSDLGGGARRIDEERRVGRRPEGGFGDRPIRLERVECRAGHYMAFKDGKGSAVRDDPHIIDIAEAIGGDQPFRTRLAQDETRSEEHTSELQSLMRRSYAGLLLK